MASAKSAILSGRRRAIWVIIEATAHIILLLVGLHLLEALTYYYWVASLHSEGRPLASPDPQFGVWARERAAFHHGWFNVVRAVWLLLLVKSAYSLVRWFWWRGQSASKESPAP